jgi:hypothetical protein
LTKKPLTIQDTHLETVLDSKSRPSCQARELSSGTSTSVTTNTDLESKTTTQVITDNGGPSTGEPRPSELWLTETRSSPFKSVVTAGPITDTLLLLETSKTITNKE